MSTSIRTVGIALLLTLPLGLLAQGPLDPSLLLKPPTDAWPSYHGDYTGRHFSPLQQVTVANVKNLSLAWLHRTSTATDGATIMGGAEAAPAAGGPAAGAAAPVV